MFWIGYAAGLAAGILLTALNFKLNESKYKNKNGRTKENLKNE